jgi:hypothetical protein
LTGTGFALLLLTASGCPGTLDPSEFPNPTAGAAGTGSSTPGTAGTGSGTGVAGTGGGGTFPGCADAIKILTAGAPYHTCNIAGACHDMNGAAAGLDMASPGWETKLVGKVPPTSATGVCYKDATYKTKAYIVAKTNPAQGLFLDKLKMAVCAGGARMPNTGDYLTAAEMTCIQQWADKLANQ